MSVQLTKLLPSAPQIVLSGVLKGVYAAGTDYAPGDVVTYQGGTYIMHTDAAAGTAPTDTAAWQAINSPQAYVESINELSLVNTSTDNTISVDQNGNVGTDVATDGAIHIENTGNTGIGLGVYTNIGATADASLVKIQADNVAFDQTVVDIVNDGVGNGLKVTQTTAVTANNASIYLAMNAVLDSASKYGQRIYTNQIHTNGHLLNLTNDHADSVATCLAITQDGNGNGIALTHNGLTSGYGMSIARAGNHTGTIAGMRIVVDNAGSGGVVGIDFSTMSDTEPLFKLVSTDTDLSSKSPETDAEAGWFPVLVGTTTYAVPIYALS